MTRRIPAGSPRLLRRLNSAAVLRTIVSVSPRVVLSTLGAEAVAPGAARLALQVIEERLFDVGLSEAS